MFYQCLLVDGFQFFCNKRCYHGLGSVSVRDRLPPTRWLNQQSFCCSGIGVGLSWKVLVLSTASAVVTDEAGLSWGLAWLLSLSFLDPLPPWPMPLPHGLSLAQQSDFLIHG